MQVPCQRLNPSQHIEIEERRCVSPADNPADCRNFSSGSPAAARLRAAAPLCFVRFMPADGIGALFAISGARRL